MFPEATGTSDTQDMNIVSTYALDAAGLLTATLFAEVLWKRSKVRETKK
jgi:hypothetical protein